MEGWVKTVDYHTAGEPFRIVTEGFPGIDGHTVADRRERALRDEEVDGIRRTLCHEPRGHADMYGGFIVPPDDEGAHFGVLFWHKDGFSTACGHGTIALAIWAIDSGLVEPKPDGRAEVIIDVPSGRVRALVNCDGRRPKSVTFRNVVSYVLAQDVEVMVSGHHVNVDISYGGAIYASVEASKLGLRVSSDRYPELIALGREIKRALADNPAAVHPYDARMSGIYGVVFFEDAGEAHTGPKIHQRNVTVFADGQVDRSPCGSGTSARLALLATQGAISVGTDLLHESIIGGRFVGRVVDTVSVGDRDGFITEITGMAYRTGVHAFIVDPEDPLGHGYVLR